MTTTTAHVENMPNGLLLCEICPDEGGEGLTRPFQQRPRDRILPLLHLPPLGIAVELLLDRCPVARIVLDDALLQSVLNGVRVCLGPAVGERIAPRQCPRLSLLRQAPAQHRR
jgi:hypothetical protein